MRYIFSILPLLFFSSAASGFSKHVLKGEQASPGYVQRYVDSVLSAEPFLSSQVGILAVKFSGDTIVRYGNRRKMIPASNLKLITTGLVLNELGPDFKVGTGIGYRGVIEGGILRGDVYIIGGGDPTTGSNDSIAIPADQLFAQWKSLLSAAGINKIEGRIIGDGRAFGNEAEVGSWQYEDLGTYYGAGGSGLCFYRNVQDFQVKAGAAPGEPLSISPAYPATPWMRFFYDCSTGEAGTGDRLYLYNSDLAPVAVMKGTFAVDRKPKKVECSNKFGVYTCAYHFCGYLQRNGMEVSGGAADIAFDGSVRTDPSILSSGEPASATGELTVLGSTLSPGLKRIVAITNERSDNFYAESCLRLLGLHKKGSASYNASTEAAEEALRRLGLDISNGCNMVDGSGLSKKNLVSPDFMCSFLRRMMDTPVFGDYARSLPQPGKGYQVGRLRNESPELTGRIHYKSGSMDGVRCYSGYVVPSDGGKEDTLVFSVMINNYTGPVWKIMSTIDNIIAAIARTV